MMKGGHELTGHIRPCIFNATIMYIVCTCVCMYEYILCACAKLMNSLL